MSNLNSIWFNVNVGHTTLTKRYGEKKIDCLIRGGTIFQDDIEKGLSDKTKETLRKLFDSVIEEVDNHISKQRRGE